MLWLTLVAAAPAAELRPVRAGDTVESLADGLGDPTLAAAIREANGLASGQQPTVGQVLTLPPPVGESADQEGFLISIVGLVTVQPPSRSAVPAVRFASIETGSTVCTGVNSYATLRLATQCSEDGSGSDDVVLYEQTCVVVESVFGSTLGRGTVVRVAEGSVAVLHQRGAQGHISVVTDSGVTTGAEGGFRVHIEDEAMRTEALDAEVAVQGAGEELVLDAGQGSRVRTGEAPSDPVQLEVAGALRRPGEGEVLLRPEFSWTGGEGAFAHRLEISADPVFTALVYAQTVGQPQHRPELLMLPVDGAGLWWRVAPVDRFGFLGVPSPPWQVLLPTGVR